MRAILTYHSIDESGSPISCHPEAFADHVRWLASGRVRVVSMERLQNLPDSTDAVALTFDDGFENFARHAAPRLADHGLPSTVFVVADATGRTNAWETHGRRIPILPLLDWDQLGRLTAHGVTLGSHTRTHQDLTRVEDASRLSDEIAGAADVIEARTGARPRSFAYPYGAFDARVEAAVASTYRVACTTAFRMMGPGEPPLRLPRLDAYYFNRSGLLESWGTPAFDRFITRRRRLRAVRATATRLMPGVLS